MTQFSSGHMMSTVHQYQYHLLNYWRNVWRVQQCTWKWSCWKERLVHMDIHRYIHEWIIVDGSRDVWYQCLISDTGIRMNDFTICVCIGDADILLLLRVFYAFIFFLCSSHFSFRTFPPNLRYSFSCLEMSAIIETCNAQSQIFNSRSITSEYH